MKARRYDRKLFKKNISLNIYPIIDSNISENTLNYLEKYNKDLFNEITYLNDIFSNASEFGSLLQVKNLNYDNALKNIKTLITNAKGTILDYNIINEIENKIIPLINQAKVLSLKYEAVVTNPPYLNKYDKQLKDFSKKNYKDYSKDLFSMFIYRNFDFCKEDGYTAFMTPTVWMFIKNYEKLRKYIIDNKSIISLIELEYLALWEIEAYVPACTFVLSNQSYNSNYNGLYLKLTEYKGGLEVQNKKVLEALNHNDKNKYFIKQDNFDKIPGSPIAYWIDNNLISCFNNTKLESLASVKQGLATADNNRFLRFWYEVDFNKIGFSSKTCEESELTNKKWFPYNKGGSFRKWYGNQEYILNFENNGFELENFEKANVSNREFQFNESISWSRISSSKISFRDYPQGFLFDSASCSIFLNKSIAKEYILGLLNTNVSQEILNCIAPTLNYQAGDISLIPIIFNEQLEKNIIDLVNENIAISKRDWDDYEISWNFKTHPLLKYENNSIKTNFNVWEQYKNTELNLLTHNEMELNLLFSKIYNVKLDTEIKSQASITIANLKEDIKSFISYAVGCMFGRYSLDCEGLNFAGGNFDLTKYNNFIPDDDNIIPVLDSEYFEDDIVGRFVEFVKTCFGEETLEENLDFIANALGKSKKPSREKIRDYMLKNFFNDHKKTYKKRPIYWQFSSGKQNGFNCLIYIHRYESSLVARIRTDYLHKTQKAIEQAIINCDNIIKHSSSNTEINKATKDKNRLQKQLQETQEYDEILAHIANQNIELDLDDGIKENYNIFQNIELTQEGKKSKKVNLLKKI